MTPAEANDLVIRAGQQADFRMKEYHRHGSTLETCLKRIMAVRDMRSVVMGDNSPAPTEEDEVQLLHAFDEETRLEVGYWMEVYIVTAPKMIAARRAAGEAFADLDRAQERISAELASVKGGGG